MADEVTVRSSMIIKKGNLDYVSRPTVFTADMDTAAPDGPSPGSITVSTAGTDVDLSELSVPGFCVLYNLDSTNYVTYGIWDPEGARFYPLGELLPGEIYILRLARNIQEELGTGTGTLGADTNRLRIKANNASCNIFVGAFEK